MILTLLRALTVPEALSHTLDPLLNIIYLALQIQLVQDLTHFLLPRPQTALPMDILTS